MKENSPAVVTTIVRINPDHLIELGHRLKQTAMDNALPGQTLLVALTDEITLSYAPEKEFCKPVHKTGYMRLDLESTPVEGTA